jgi:N-acetylglucosaminyldiphosphoundecaprenol N-acetyl-beta-D-mannosaminyltransferase
MPRQRVRLMGLEIDTLREADTIAHILAASARKRGGFVITPNLDHLRQVRRRPELARLFNSAELVVADGMPLVWASRLQGTPLPERVAGSELVWSLTAEAALHGRSVFLLGGAPGACEQAEAKLRAVYPGAKLAGHWCPPVGFEYDPREIDAIRSRIRAASPDIVYVALGFPKQERLIAYLRTEFPATWFIGVGYSLSFIAGHARRAPAWMMRFGLEWLHRLVQEPGRLARRYLAQGIPFAFVLFASALRGRVLGTARYVPASATETEGSVAGDRSRVVFASGSLERSRAQLLAELMEPE